MGAFVTLPYAEFVEGTINEDNIGFGALCPLPAGGLPADALVHGLVIFSKRSAAISVWLTGIDLVFVKASLETREVLLEVGLDTQYLLARIKDPQQKLEAQLFEEGKETTNGLHFLSIQSPRRMRPTASGCSRTLRRWAEAEAVGLRAGLA